jgi:hypothetical protein
VNVCSLLLLLLLLPSLLLLLPPPLLLLPPPLPLLLLVVQAQQLSGVEQVRLEADQAAAVEREDFEAAAALDEQLQVRLWVGRHDLWAARFAADGATSSDAHASRVQVPAWDCGAG